MKARAGAALTGAAFAVVGAALGVYGVYLAFVVADLVDDLIYGAPSRPKVG